VDGLFFGFVSSPGSKLSSSSSGSASGSGSFGLARRIARSSISLFSFSVAAA
jgi:hypothetical protein